MLMVCCSESIARAIGMEPVYRFEMPHPSYMMVSCPGTPKRYRWHIQPESYLQIVLGGDGRPCRKGAQP